MYYFSNAFNNIATFLPAFFAAFSVVLVVTKCTGNAQTTTGRFTTNYGIQLGVQYNPDAISFPTSIETKSNYQHQHSHPHFHEGGGFQHDPNFHHFHHHHHHHHQDHDPKPGFPQQENVEGPSQEEGGSEEFSFGNSSLIPLELIHKINNFTEVNDLLVNLVDGDIEQEETAAGILTSRFGEGERSAAIVPKSAACLPELQTVKIISDDDPSVLYIPSCTRIERCGGCCSHSLLMCQPKETETISYQVVKTQFVGGSKLKYMGKEIVLAEKHIKCKCDCRVQEKDCTAFQEYKKNECRCVCTNLDEEKKCYKDNATKLWNPDLCACECRSIHQCSTGFMFDTIRCKCMPVLVRRRYVDMQSETEPELLSDTKSEVLPVVPLEEIDNDEN